MDHIQQIGWFWGQNPAFFHTEAATGMATFGLGAAILAIGRQLLALGLSLSTLELIRGIELAIGY